MFKLVTNFKIALVYKCFRPNDRDTSVYSLNFPSTRCAYVLCVVLKIVLIGKFLYSIVKLR